METGKRCVAPLDDEARELCGQPATTERTVEDVVMPLCGEHAAELDEEEMKMTTRSESDLALVHIANDLRRSILQGDTGEVDLIARRCYVGTPESETNPGAAGLAAVYARATGLAMAALEARDAGDRDWIAACRREWDATDWSAVYEEGRRSINAPDEAQQRMFGAADAMSRRYHEIRQQTAVDSLRAAQEAAQAPVVAAAMAAVPGAFAPKFAGWFDRNCAVVRVSITEPGKPTRKLAVRMVRTEDGWRKA